MKTAEEIIQTLKSHKVELKNKFKVEEIGLFGSYIRGEQKEKSDIDILVEFDEPVSLLSLVGAENHLTTLLGIKVDLVPKKDLRPELRENIIKEAVFL